MIIESAEWFYEKSLLPEIKDFQIDVENKRNELGVRYEE